MAFSNILNVVLYTYFTVQRHNSWVLRLIISVLDLI